MGSRHLSLRIADATFERLEQRREALGEPRSRVAERLLDEGLRMDEHPGIVFRPGPAGRRPALVNGADVWEVIGVFREVEGSGEEAIEETSDLTGLDRQQVRTAVRYYADHQDEIDAWIERVRAEAEQAEHAWRRRQRVLA
jgi:uncharacterized protein (DUF433 family)